MDVEFLSSPHVRTPSVMEMHASFPFQAKDITIPNKRPPAEVVSKLIKGFERNARFSASISATQCGEVLCARLQVVKT